MFQNIDEVMGVQVFNNADDIVIEIGNIERFSPSSPLVTRGLFSTSAASNISAINNNTDIENNNKADTEGYSANCVII